MESGQLVDIIKNQICFFYFSLLLHFHINISCCNYIHVYYLLAGLMGIKTILRMLEILTGLASWSLMMD